MDKIEIQAVHPEVIQDFTQALERCIRLSYKAYIILDQDNNPYGIFGIASDLHGGGMPWMLGDVSPFSKKFARVSKLIINDLCSGFDNYYNYTYVGAEKTHRWLEWLGFTVNREQFIRLYHDIKMYKFTKD